MQPQSQDYKIVFLDPGKEPYFDMNQNQWVNVLFEGAQNEPIKWVVKDLSRYNVGDVVYGHIEVKTSQAGKPYNRFYRDQKPDYGQAAQAGAVAGSKYQPRDDNTQESIARSVALKAAVDAHNHAPGAGVTSAKILETADTFLVWLQNSKSALPTATHSAIPTTTNQAQPVRQWNSVGQNRQEEPLPDEPMGFDLGGEQFPVDDIPFN